MRQSDAGTRAGIFVRIPIALFLTGGLRLWCQTPEAGADPLIEAVNYLDEGKASEAANPERAQQWYRKCIAAARAALRNSREDARKAGILQTEAEKSLDRVSLRLRDLNQAFRTIGDLQKQHRLSSALRLLDSSQPPESQPRFRTKRDELKDLADHAARLVTQADHVPKSEYTLKARLYRQALSINSEIPEALEHLEQIEELK